MNNKPKPLQRQRGVILDKRGKQIPVIEATLNEANRNWIRQIEREERRLKGSQFIPNTRTSKYH